MDASSDNEKLYEKVSDYFTRMCYPVPKEVDDEVIRYICKYLTLSIGSEVFLCLKYAYSQIYSEKDMVSSVVSLIKRAYEIQKELETMRKVDMESKESNKKSKVSLDEKEIGLFHD